ncbi:diphthamide biosynthesis 7 [Haematococcus lacustris]|uniref:methylated diphthine methylhydrolase n=1 Tax=Haematococcus lacustris TaxID=44745 RepID=A0A699Z1T9_HAELA|nr:diphthamide biosynthesis 7 [Haematococcus lacustris]
MDCPASSSKPQTLAVSTSDGQLALLQVTPACLAPLVRWDAHNAEVWSVAHYGNCQARAADDAWSQSLDLEPPTCMHTNRKAHAAGVCSIAPHPAHQHIVATGSYDDQLRIWDLRQTAWPVVLSQASTTGGVWRLKWHPHDPTKLLAACMYGGFQVFSTVAVPKTGEAAGEGECQGHGSGGQATAGSQDLVVTASFYDQLLHLWSPES